MSIGRYFRVRAGGTPSWARQQGEERRLLDGDPLAGPRDRAQAIPLATAALLPPAVWYVSRVMTLRPGDIISTGTPAGVGPLRPGDVTEIEVEGVGTLGNPVVEG